LYLFLNDFLINIVIALLQDFFNSNIFQHFSQGDFAISLGTSGLALTWKVAAPLLYTSDDIWIAIAIASAIVFGLSILVFLVWVVLHPSKVCYSS
jgi:hypothetical protein